MARQLAEKARFLVLQYPLSANRVETFDTVTTAVTEPGDKQGMRLDDNGVCCHQSPALPLGLCEKSASTLMGSVFYAQQGEESAGVDEDALHFAPGAAAYAAARWRYLSMDTSS